MRDGINILYFHTFRYVEADRCIIQDRFHSSLHKLISNLLRTAGRDCNHCEFDLMLFDFFRYQSGVKDFKLTNFLPNLFGVVIKYHFDVETTICEPLIMCERSEEHTSELQSQ